MYYHPSDPPAGASASAASSAPSVSCPAPAVVSSSPTITAPFFWVDFMVPDTSSLLHSANPSHRFYSDLLLFIGYLIGKRQTRDSLSGILDDYHIQIQLDDVLFERYAATVLAFIKQQRASN